MFKSRSAGTLRIEKEIQDLSSALEDLKRHISHDTRDHYGAIKERAEQLWDHSREHLGAGYEDLSRLTAHAGRQARDCAREHPVGTLLIGVGVLAVIGWLLSRD